MASMRSPYQFVEENADGDDMFEQPNFPTYMNNGGMNMEEDRILRAPAAGTVPLGVFQKQQAAGEQISLSSYFEDSFNVAAYQVPYAQDTYGVAGRQGPYVQDTYGNAGRQGPYMQDSYVPDASCEGWSKVEAPQGMMPQQQQWDFAGTGMGTGPTEMGPTVTRKMMRQGRPDLGAAPNRQAAMEPQQRQRSKVQQQDLLLAMEGLLHSLPQNGGRGAGGAGGAPGPAPRPAGCGPGADVLKGSATPPADWGNTTTVMMRNLPNKYTQRMLLTEISQSGFLGTFDFLYLPIDPETNANRGYAFLNFIDPGFAWMLKMTYEGRRMNRFNSSKVVAVMPATLQGFEANYAHYATARVNRGDPAARPLFLREPQLPTPDGRRAPRRRGGEEKGADRTAVQQMQPQSPQQQQRPWNGTAAPPQAPCMAGPVASPAARPAQTLAKFCPHCGGAVQPTFQFCPQCGSSL